MADKYMDMSANGGGSDSDDVELAALREAALRSKRLRVEETKCAEAASPLPTALRSVTPSIAACPPVRPHLHRQPYGGRGQTRMPRTGSQNFIRNARSNLIVIQTVPLEEDKPVAPPPPKPEAYPTSQEKFVIVRPQDRWAATNDVKQSASPAKPKVPTKFDRYHSSGSDTDEDLSSHKSSDSEDDSVRKDTVAIVSHEEILEPQPNSEQFHSDSAFTVENADWPASDASPRDLPTKSSKLLLDLPVNSPPSKTVQENQSSKKLSSKSIPSTEDSPSNSQSLSPNSKFASPASSESVCSQSVKQTKQSDALRNSSKSPLDSNSQSRSRSCSLTRSLSPSNYSLLESQVCSDSSASLTPSRSRSKSPMHRSTDFVKSPSCQMSPVRARSPVDSMSSTHSSSPVNLQSPTRSRSKTHSRSRSSLRSPMYLMSKAKSRSPGGVRSASKSPAHLWFKSHSRSPQNLRSRLRKRSRSRSRSPVKFKSRLHPQLRTQSRSPASVSSRMRLRPSTRSRSPVNLRSEVPLRSRTRSRSPSSLHSSKCYRSPLNTTTRHFNKSPLYGRSPVHSKSPTFSRLHEHLRSPDRRRLPVLSGSPRLLKRRTVSRSPLQSRSSEHMRSPKYKRSPRISRSPGHRQSRAHSTSPKISRSPRCYGAPVHRSSRRISRSPRHYRSPRCSKALEEIPRSPRRYRSLERSSTPRRDGSHAHSRSPRIPQSPVHVKSSKSSLLFSQFDGKSRSKLAGSWSPTYSRSSSPGNGNYRFTSEMLKPRNGDITTTSDAKRPPMCGSGEEVRSHRHGSKWLEADRLRSKYITYQHSSRYSAGTECGFDMETKRPEGRLNIITDAHNLQDIEIHGLVKRNSSDLKQHSSDYLKDQRSWHDSDFGTGTEKSTDVKLCISEYDQLLEMRKRKFVPAEGSLHSGRLQSRNDDRNQRGLTTNEAFQRGSTNCKKHGDRKEYQIQNRNEQKSDCMQSRLDKKSDSKTNVSEERLDVRSRSTQKFGTAIAKAAEKSFEADERNSETTSSEAVSSRPSQCRPLPSDDSDSEIEASVPREKHFTERNDLPIANPALKIVRDNKFRHQGYRERITRYTRRQQNIASREYSGMRQSYIPSLMEGVRLGKLRSRSRSPQRLRMSPSQSPVAKRARNDSPPIKSVLGVVKLAKSASSIDIGQGTETKQSDQSDEKDSLAKRSLDEDKSNVVEAETSRGSSDIRKDARSIVKKMDDKCDTGNAPSGDQRTIQITFNQKMDFDESVKLPSRPSVHQRLGNLETGAQNEKALESSSRQIVAEEKKFVDLRDLIGEKSRQIVYRMDSPDAREPEEMEEEAGADELFPRRKKPRPGRRRRNFNDNTGGKLEGRQPGRSNYS